MPTDDVVAVFPRLSRAGLGNMLFPWSRAIARATDPAVAFLEPHWWRPRVGPYLRREPDKRQYQRVFVQPSLGRLRRTAGILLRQTLVAEDGEVLRRRSGPGRVLIVEGMTGYFDPLWAARPEIARRFWALVKPALLGDLLPAGPYLSMHVRLGDFRPAAPGEARIDRNNTSTPLSWFVAQAEALRAAAPDQPILVCSDGTDAELTPLLAVPGVRRSPNRISVQDILVLARSSLIVGSGSTFSAWAAFLGDTPIVHFPGQNRYLGGWAKASETDLVDPALLSGGPKDDSGPF